MTTAPAIGASDEGRARASEQPPALTPEEMITEIMGDAPEGLITRDGVALLLAEFDRYCKEIARLRRIEAAARAWGAAPFGNDGAEMGALMAALKEESKMIAREEAPAP